MKKFKNDKIFYYLIILIISILMCIPLFQKGIHTGHDGDFHISRVVGTIEQLQQGNSTFVISRFSNELGFGWNLFYPPISTLINVIFAIITNDFILAMKLFIFCTFLFSGISMFQLVNAITENKMAAIFASILYVIAPYRLLNAYTRVAVGEMASFIFIPIILRGVYLIFQGKTDKSYLYVFGTIGLVLSHNISTMLTFILGFCYVLLNVKQLKDKKILKTFVISTVIIILSVIFFEVPLLEQKATAEYEVFRYGKMYSEESVSGHALNPLQLFYRNAPGPDSSMYFCIGIPVALSLILIPFSMKRLNENDKKDYKFFLGAGIIATIMSTVIFPWIIMPDILLMIQFPWRMLVLVTLCFSIIGGINISILLKYILQKAESKKIKNLINIISIVLVICSCIYSLTFLKDLEIEEKNNEFYKEDEIIDVENKVSRYSSFLEYWPQKAIDSMDYIVNRDNKIHILSGGANITKEEKENGILSCNIEDVEESTCVELPYLFYKGYEIEYISDATNERKILEALESEHGLVQVNIDTNIEGKIKVSYHITLLHKSCIIISFSTIIIYSIYTIIKALKINKENKDDNRKFRKRIEGPKTE